MLSGLFCLVFCCWFHTVVPLLSIHHALMTFNQSSKDKTLHLLHRNAEGQSVRRGIKGGEYLLPFACSLRFSALKWCESCTLVASFLLPSDPRCPAACRA